MRQNLLECWANPDKWPYQVEYITSKQKNKKLRYFASLTELTDWCNRHRGSTTLLAGSWQAFELMGV